MTKRVIRKEHVLRFEIPVYNLKLMQLLNTLANLVECVLDPVVLEHAKTPTELPDLVLGVEHLGEEVKVKTVFKGGNQPNSWHLGLLLGLVVSFFDLLQSVLLHQDVKFSAHVLDFFDFANFKSVITTWELLMIDLEDLGKVAITQLLNRLKVIIDKSFVFGSLC